MVTKNRKLLEKVFQEHDERSLPPFFDCMLPWLEPKTFGAENLTTFWRRCNLWNQTTTQTLLPFFFQSDDSTEFQTKAINYFQNENWGNYADLIESEHPFLRQCGAQLAPVFKNILQNQKLSFHTPAQKIQLYYFLVGWAKCKVMQQFPFLSNFISI